jgi:hypothetical protein
MEFFRKVGFPAYPRKKIYDKIAKFVLAITLLFWIKDNTPPYQIELVNLGLQVTDYPGEDLWGRN